MSPEDVARLFTRSDGSFLFARWGRPLAPVVFGVADASLPVVKGGLEAVAALADHGLAQTDPELGSNYMMFFFRDWQELTGVPNLGRMIDDLPGLVARLQAADANQYRMFRFDGAGAICACFVFLRMDPELAAVPAETLSLSQAVQSFLLWSDTAFSDRSPLARLPSTGATILRPEIGSLIRAAYDPALPDVSDDPATALRLYARLGAAQ